jgi:hypothetical protein
MCGGVLSSMCVSLDCRNAAASAITPPVEVLRGTHKDLTFQFGPLPGSRLENVVAYEFELPGRFEPWPGRTHAVRRDPARPAARPATPRPPSRRPPPRAGPSSGLPARW